MTTPNVVIPTAQVTGDITSCRIEKQEIRVDRKNAFSLRETKTYVSYDVCNKQVIERFQVQGFTDFGVAGGALLLLVTGFFLIQFFVKKALDY